MNAQDLIALKKQRRRQFTIQFLDLLSDSTEYIQVFVRHELSGFNLDTCLDLNTVLEAVYVLGLNLIEQDIAIDNPTVWVRKMAHRMLLFYHWERGGDAHPIPANPTHANPTHQVSPLP
jgi:hypothetical protein